MSDRALRPRKSERTSETAGDKRGEDFRSRRNAGYNGPTGNSGYTKPVGEPRCYDQGDGTEKCFYDQADKHRLNNSGLTAPSEFANKLKGLFVS